MTISKRLAGTLVLLVATFLALYWNVFVWLLDDWELDGEYSHGLAIIPLALYLAWERRRKLASLPTSPSGTGLILVFGSLLLLAAGTLGAETFLTRISIIGTVAGTIVYVLGWRHLRELAFPVGFLLLMIPIPAIIFNRVTIPLQLLASRAGEAALDALRIPVLREGNLIVLADVTLHVAEACSGIRSLMSLFTLGVLYGYFREPRSWARVVLCLSTVPIAIVTNGLRVSGTGVAAYYYGPKVADGFFHTFSGVLVFVAASGLLILVHRTLQWIAPVPPAPEECVA
jgi:exosortase